MVKKILILGASGMLGNAVLRFFADSEEYIVKGTVRTTRMINKLPPNVRSLLINGIDVENNDCLLDLFCKEKPDVVINCIGLVKQLSESDVPLFAIPINSLLPHRLARLCEIAGARLVHLSTDCVFSGLKGMYLESDTVDANDIYGKSKFLGEVDCINAITLRTSIIGHELDGSRSLVDWFLSQKGSVKGYKRAIFSGLPTVEIARIIRDYVLPNPGMRGVYHVSASPISKYELLKLVKVEYNKSIEIVCDNDFVIDRSLDSSRFRSITGYQPNDWLELVKIMKRFG